MQKETSNIPPFVVPTHFDQQNNIFTLIEGVRGGIHGTKKLSKNFKLGLKLLSKTPTITIVLPFKKNTMYFSPEGIVSKNKNEIKNANLKSENGDNWLFIGNNGNLKLYRNETLVYDEDDFIDKNEDYTFTPIITFWLNDKIEILEYS